jgi:hypothetical protein
MGSASANTVLDRLEKGEVISTHAGSAFLVQALVDSPASFVLNRLTGDLDSLSQNFEAIAFSKAFVTSTDKRLLYMKLRGVGDGAVVMMEVKQGAAGLFANAVELVKSGSLSREPALADLDAVGDNGLGKVFAEQDPRAAVYRNLGKEQSVVLEGPLNPLPQFPQLRMTIAIGVAPYSKTDLAKGTSKNQSLLQVKVAFGHQALKGGELGDFKGFTQRRLQIAKNSTVDVVRAIRSRLEKI